MFVEILDDAKYKFNSGVMILKNNEWTKKIFEDTWNDNTPHGYGGNRRSSYNKREK